MHVTRGRGLRWEWLRIEMIWDAEDHMFFLWLHVCTFVADHTNEGMSKMYISIPISISIDYNVFKN